MEVHVLFFGSTKDVVGKGNLTFILEENTTIKEFKNILQNKYSGFSQINTIAFAVNETYVNNSYELIAGDVVALIPPVSGG